MQPATIRAVWAGVVVTALASACAGDESEQPRQPFQSDGVHFSLTPSAARDCDPETRYVAVLRWDVERAKRTRVEIRIDRLDGQLLARSNEASSSVQTGDWVQRGMWFLLVDRDSGDLLAAQRAGPDNCD